MSNHIYNESTSNDHVNTPNGNTPVTASPLQPVAGPSTSVPKVYNHQPASVPTSTTIPYNAGPSTSRVYQPNGHAHPQSTPTNPTSSIVPATAPAPTPSPAFPLSQIERESIGRKRKWSSLGFNTQEQETMERTTTAYHYALAQDQLTTLFPDPPTAFQSYDDMVRRLVPYHIWQTCDEELDGYEDEEPAKRKARETKEGKEASDLLSRMTKINQRFMNLRTLDAQKPSPTVDLIYMIKESTAVLREELSTVQARLRTATAEHNAIEWEERARMQKARQAEIQRREAEERRIAAMVAANTKHGQSPAPTPTPAPAPALAPIAKPSASTPATPAAGVPVPTPVVHTPLFETRPGRVKPIPPLTATPVPAPTPAVAVPNAPAPASAIAPTAVVQPTPTRGRGRPRKTQDVPSPAIATSLPKTGAMNGPSLPPLNGNAISSSSSIDGPKATETAMKPITQSSLPITTPASASVSPGATPGPTTPASGQSRPAAPSSGTRATRSNPAPVLDNGPTPGLPSTRPGPMKGPVSITVPIASVPDLLRADVLSRDPEGVSRAPATIARKAEDKKSVVLSIDLSRCSPKQLLALAKILKVDTATNGGARDAVAQVAEGS